MTDLAATGAAGSVVIGHLLGLYRALPPTTVVGSDYHLSPSSWRARMPRGRSQRPGQLRGGHRADLHRHQLRPGDDVDCLHDMGDPLGAAPRVREALARDGTWLLVEPFAADKVEDNFNPVTTAVARSSAPNGPPNRTATHWVRRPVRPRSAR